MIPGQPGSEFRLYAEDYAPAVRGKKVEFDEEDRPRLHVPVPIEQRMASVGGSVIIRFDLICVPPCYDEHWCTFHTSVHGRRTRADLSGGT